jgi:hypothetical protein
MPPRSGAFAALAVYALLTIALTWPLARGLTRDVPADLADPLLNAWIVTHDAQTLTRAMAGNFRGLHAYWNPPIFSPHPLALAYSEHLTPQALQILPVYWASHNPLLCYNVLFLSTFILSAFGMFLLVRELTGNLAAAFVAGLAFGFAPYRIAALSHLQVLSSAWMPFTLYGFRRFFVTRRTAPLAGAVIAWIAQNLSCGYYLLFFSPIVALYLAWELTMRRLWRDRGVLARLAAAFVAMTAVTLPFLLPYVRLRALGFHSRSLDETLTFSADVFAYATADVHLRLWGGSMRAWPGPEGSLFPGLTVVALTIVAIAHLWRRSADGESGPRPVWARILVWTLAAASAVAVALVCGWSLRVPTVRPVIKIASVNRELMVLAAIAALLFGTSRRARERAHRVLKSPIAFFVAITLLAMMLSLGPAMNARGRLVEDGTLYGIFFRYVPGFDGVRVPARFGMIVAFGLAVLAGCGCAELGRSRPARWLVAIAGLLIVAEGCAVPIPINVNDTTYKQTGLAALPDELAPNGAPPAVYGFVERLPASSVLLELPLGEPAFDARYMFYALGHGRTLVNGYSGGAPEPYLMFTEELQDFATDPDQAWRAVLDSGATHVIVHEASYDGNRGRRVSAWLLSNGARIAGTFGSDRVFEIAR